jgi:hypothetical protein
MKMELIGRICVSGIGATSDLCRNVPETSKDLASINTGRFPLFYSGYNARFFHNSAHAERVSTYNINTWFEIPNHISTFWRDIENSLSVNEYILGEN